MIEYNKRFQQVGIFVKFTEADPSADIHFSWLCVGEAIRWVDRNSKETVKQSCWGFLRTGTAKDCKIKVLPCLGKDAHVYCSNWSQRPHQKTPSYQKSQRTASMETCCCCMLPVHLTQSWEDTAAPAALLNPGLPLCTASNPEQGLTVPMLLQINSLSDKAAGNKNQAYVPTLEPKPLVWLHMTAYAERVHKGKGMQGTDIANLAQIQPLQTTPCTGLSRRARSSQHSSPSANLSISMPICINIFLQRERGKLPGGSWAGDP